MKRIIFSVLSFFASFGLCAAEVPQGALSQAAINFWNTYRPVDVKPANTSNLQAMSLESMPHLAIYAFGDEGFVIMSADDRVRPVLAYSFDSPFPAEPHPSLHAWLKSYDAQIEYAVKNDIAAPEWVGAQWGKLLGGAVPPVPLMLTEIPALCATKWNQSDIGDTYNRLCPYDSTQNERCVVGCVATAMAQIMKYWNHPSHGEGSHSYTPVTWPGNDTLYGTLSADFENTTYQWEYMPTSLQPFSIPRYINAVARLSYHCGVAVEMMYGTATSGGSGAYTHAWAPGVPSADNALRDYFRYNDSLHSEYRSNYDSAAWASLIAADLEAGRPILYTGDDSTSGHAFILDGSDIHGRYHFNWGWGGYGDGFYYIDSLTPGGGGAGGNATYSFNLDQSAIFSIFPIPETFDTIDFYDTICNNASEYIYYEYTFDPIDGDYEVHHLDTVVNLHVKVISRKYMYMEPNGAEGYDRRSRAFCPADSIVIPECPFEREGYVFDHWSTNYAGGGTWYYEGQKAKRPGSFTLYAQWIDANDTIGDTLGIVQTLAEAVGIGPNPTGGMLTVSIPVDATITIFDALGRIVATKEAVGGTVEIDLTKQPSGLFTVQVRTAKDICNKRVIKQ